MPTILIVDDLGANRDLLATVLSREGHEILHAADGAEGLVVARAGMPSLIITDVLMPVMDGYEFFRQLRLDPLISGIPVIFYTAHYAEREGALLALANGVADVLPKTSSNSEVLAIVNRVLSTTLDDAARRERVPVTDTFTRDHLKLVTDMLSEKTGDILAANARLRAIINIGLELASDNNSDLRLDTVCRSVRDLFSASYAVLGILDSDGRTLLRSYCAGVDPLRWTETERSIREIIRTAADEHRTIRSDDAVLDDGTRKPHSLLVAPIASPGRLHGWICLVKTDETHFLAEDEQLVQALAGQIGRIYELDFEIRERTRMESSLRRERDRVRLYLDTAEVVLLGLDAAGRVETINRHGCKVLEWTAAELIGRDWIDTCLPERFRTEMRAKLESVHAGHVPPLENCSTWTLTRSGGERRIQWHNAVLYDEAGTVTGTLSSGNDVTVESTAVDALVSAEERMRFALGAANIGIWDMDFRTGVLEWSDVLERHYGLQPGSFPGTFAAFIECIHPLDRSEVIQTMEEHKSTGTDFTMFHRALWPDGTVRWLGGAGRIYLDNDGAPLRGVGTSRDITEQKTADERMQQGQRMEAIGRLASGVAHDFNNLLTVILGFAGLIAADSAVESQHGDDLDEIIKAGQRAAGLTSQLLAFSRQQVMNLTAVDVNALVTGMAGMLTRLIGEDIDVSLSLSPELDLAFADRGQIEQVVMNLVVNARDAMPAGGKLRLTTANVQLENSSFHDHPMEAGEYVMFSVTDSGEGMTRETQRRVFEPFFTTKRTGNGTGLGLSTTYGIVKQSKGYIWVYSEPGLGATFKVYLPRATNQSPSKAVHYTPAGSHRRGTETLLLVEDEGGVREFSRRTLVNAGYRVLHASNGDEAEEVFAEYADSIALVITDVVMPGCGGPELLERIWLTSPAAKVLYMSGYTDHSAVTDMDVGGQVRFLQKPFRAAELLRHVRDALDYEGVLTAQ